MGRLTENKIVLVTRKTRLDELISRFNTESQARFYIEHLGADFEDYREEDITYKKSIQKAERILAKLGRVQVVDRLYISNFIFGEKDIVVALGQDGLVANVLKYLDSQPIIGVNPDPNRWEGVLLPFQVSDLPEITPEVFQQNCKMEQITIAQAQLNTGQTIYGVNDLFIGPKSHTSARYIIQLEEEAEHQSSSGIIVSTGLGSTGWFRSVLTGATGVSSKVTGREIKVRKKSKFNWSSEYLYFSVREPWPSKTTSAKLTFGRVTHNKPLLVTSLMPENGVIFSDGIEADFLEFNSGTKAKITVSEKKGSLVT